MTVPETAAGKTVASLLLMLAVGCSGGEPAKPSGFVAGFVDHAAKSGIDFKMAFLPGEQGENFKINLYDHGAGVALADIDGDGDDDVYFCNQLGPNRLFRNNGDGTFVDATTSVIAMADRISVCAVFNDVDNDGDQDLFVTSTRGGNAMFRNDGTGTFTDVTKESGLELVAHSQGAAFFDADRDGDLDLLVTNTARWTFGRASPRQKYYEGAADLLKLVESPIEHNVYYRNKGDGTFENATAGSGLKGVGWGGDIAVFDYDEDDDFDVFVTNMFGRSALYRNDGGTFTDVTRATLGKTPWGTVGARAFDYDGDGRLDLFLVDMHSDMWCQPETDPGQVEEKKKYKAIFGRRMEDPTFNKKMEGYYAQKMKVPYADVFFGNGLYRNLGGGRFEETSDKAGVETWWPWGIAAADFDNDGDVDAFLPTGMGYPFFFWRNYMLVNNGDGTFTDRAVETGVEPPPGGPVLGEIGGKPAVRSSRAAAVADLDGDGRLDLVVNNFNDKPYVYRNDWPQRAWVAFRLEGTGKSNRDAIGAVIRIQAGGKSYVRLLQAAGGYLAQSSKTVHFGLGDAKRIDRCQIQWPSGRRHLIITPKINHVHKVREPR